ncbi:ubiquitin-conjugating enzyme [Nitzschia inconspicua]|uniref:Ubiquitin-conjugating enzyme n=1 Tax=Nitzschia inconspicua TaxID=303405 RepID=A0A9K3LTN2_9STRA|nr:ubiquitin-conjugating enzyme [Nitzschia inconspicua]
MNVSAKRRQSNEDEAVPQPPSSSLHTVVVRVESGFSSLATARRRSSEDDCGVIAAPPATKNPDGTVPGTVDTTGSPNHIPVVENSGVATTGTGATVLSGNNVEVEEDDYNSTSPNNNMKSLGNSTQFDSAASAAVSTTTNVNHASRENGDDLDDDDESDYEYEDEDDVAFSGFLVATEAVTAAAPSVPTASSMAPARIEEESGAAATGVNVSPTSGSTGDASKSSSSDAVAESSEANSRKKWREPTREAVNMSLRAQQETSGSKRRLAQDLYRIMNQDTEEAGFSLAPQSEDSMELWTINLFQFDPDSNLAKDMMVLGIDHIELEMKFPEQYPFEPPFVRVVKPRFKRQTGFVMNGALCAELLTKDGWNPINDIESVIVSIRSLLVVGDGRLQAAAELSDARYNALLRAAQEGKATSEGGEPPLKKSRRDDEAEKPVGKAEIGSYTAAEAQSAYSHLSDYHKKKGWDTSGWWARKG